MLTVDHIFEYLERRIAEERLAGNAIELKHLQTTAGVLMEAAHNIRDEKMALRFRVLAAEAANKREELIGED